MKLAAWKYFSVIMALVLVLGTGVIALVPAVPAAAAASIHPTDNGTRKSDRGSSENRTHPFPILSQSSGMKSVSTVPAPGTTYWVNGNSGSDGNLGTQASPWLTIQHALDTVAANNTIHVVGISDTPTLSYDELLTISKSITIIGDGVDSTQLYPQTFSSEPRRPVTLTASDLSVTFSGMEIRGQDSRAEYGGCIWAEDSTLTLENMYLHQPSSFIIDYGGCIAIDNCTLTMTGCDISGEANVNGGGIWALDSDVTLTDCWPDGYASDEGGGIWVDNSKLTLTGCVFDGPSANDGGGLYAYGSDVNVTDCYFIECEGGYAGGAINVNSSVLNALRCSFNGDWEGMDGDGQGVYINAVEDNCTVDISNCTFSENYLDGNGSGGGIYVTSQDGYADVTLTCCTFYNNEVEGYGGGLYQEGDNSTTTVRNCIFDNQADEGGDSIYVDGGTIDSDFNIYSDIPSDFTTGADDQTDTDPLCYVFSDNGGRTPTCAIDSTSPARGVGSTVLATDQRGITRGTPSDIGAYQWVGPDTYANDLTGSDANSGLSALQAKKHIYAAVNLAGPGSTTHVAAGTYDEENHWDVYDLDYYNIQITKPLTLIGAGVASTSIDGGYPVYENWGPIIDVYDVDWVFDEATVSISGLTLKNATDEDEENNGGGLAIWDDVNATVQDCVIENNYAYYGGGGIYIDDAGEVALIGCTITNNSACYDGGGIDCGADNLTISGCTISGNESTDGYGGGIYLDDCYIFSLVDSTVSGNSASEDGGGIYGEDMYGYDEAESYDTLISRCTIDDNTADGDGGGIYLYSVDDSDYPVRMEACTLSNNEAGGDGGGLYNYYDSAVNLTNCTIYGNSIIGAGSTMGAGVPIGGSGGGIYNAGHAELLNCTVASNDAGAGGEGGGWYEMGSVTGIFKNTILADNTADSGTYDIGGEGTVTSLGHNICTTDAERDYFNCETDNVSTDPHLGDLLDNGGPTKTCAISLPTPNNPSPAFNTAETGPATDQRGVIRPQYDHYDVGAYELSEAAAPTIISITPSSGVNTGTVSITNLAGTNFVSGATVMLTKIDQSDIIDTSVAFVSSSKLTCTFDLTGAATGTWNVVVTNPDAQSGTLTNGFTVTAPATAPTITSVSPNSGMWGETLVVTITGTNFTGATSVSFGPGITVTFTVVSPTQINATITIAMGADTGARNVTVTTPQGSATRSFTVNANPSLLIGTQSHGGGGGSGGSGGTGQANQGMTPVSMPNIVVQSATISNTRVAPGEAVTITAYLANKGTVNGTSAVKVYVNGQEEAVQGVTVNSGSNRPVSFTLSRNEPGTYTVYVGGTQAGSFTVEQAVDPNMILLVSTTLFLAGLVLGAIYIRRRQNYY